MAAHPPALELELEPVGLDASLNRMPLPSTLAPPTLVSPPNQGQTEPIPTTATLSTNRAIIVITQLSCINLLSAFSTGLLTISLPAISVSLSLPTNLRLWPSSVWSLTSGSTLLLSGTFASVLGAKPVHVTGCACLAATILGCGFARTGRELIAVRALQGVASSMVLPSGLSIASETLARGKVRNMGFAGIGFANMVGFSLGLVLGGLLTGSGVSWRVGYWIGGAVGGGLTGIAAWVLPSSRYGERSQSEIAWWRRLILEVDWVGAGLVSGSLAMLSYVLAMLSSSVSSIKNPANIGLLCCSIIMLLAFGIWMRDREKRHKPPLIPNSLWKNGIFLTIAVVVMITSATINCMELICSLFFQEVQHRSALTAALYILPSLLVGAFLNLATGMLIHRVPAVWAVFCSTALTAGAPLLMAVINPAWSYWRDAFFAQLLQPLARGVVFTIGMLIVSDIFPAHTQALAGAVFNTVSQFGTSIGLTTTSVVSAAASRVSSHEGSPEVTLMVGYRATWWMMFAWMALACVVGGVGLGKVGRIGLKRD